MRALLVAVMLQGAPPETHAGVEAARSAFNRGDLRDALRLLDDTEREPDLREDDLVALHWLRAMAQFALGRESEAASSMDKVLALRPLFTPDPRQTPPELRALFQKRVQAWQAKTGISVGEPHIERHVLVVPVASRTDAVASLSAYLRPTGAATYTAFEAPIVDGKAMVPVADEKLWSRAADGGLEAVLEVRNRTGTPLARKGDALHPRVLRVTTGERDAALASLAPPSPAPVKTEPPPPAPGTPPSVVIVPIPGPPAAEPAPAPPPATTTITAMPDAAPAAPPTESEPAKRGAPTRPAGIALLVGAGLLVPIVLVLGGVDGLALIAAAWAHSVIVNTPPGYELQRRDDYERIRIAGGAGGVAGAGLAGLLLVVGVGLGIAGAVLLGMSAFR